MKEIKQKMGVVTVAKIGSEKKEVLPNPVPLQAADDHEEKSDKEFEGQSNLRSILKKYRLEHLEKNLSDLGVKVEADLEFGVFIILCFFFDKKESRFVEKSKW